MARIPDSYEYVIVGAGVGAAAAAAAIRAADSGSIGIFGAQSTPPVYRPDLSKSLWLEEGKEPSSSYLLEEGLDVDLHLGVRVDSLQPGNHTVTLSGGQRINYGKVLLATGSAPRTFGVETGPRVLTYREEADYEHLRKFALAGNRIVLIGGGYIGAELTSALVQNRVDVTLVMPEENVCARIFPAELASKVTAGFVERGVEIHRGYVDQVRSDSDSATAVLKDGTELTGAAVVLGLGVSPRIEIAEKAGLKVDGGIVVDEYLRTSAPDVYAVGDSVVYPDALLGVRRVEHVDNAETMGQVAGRNLAGATEAYTHTPFFWSDLFSDGYEAVGDLDSRLDTLIDWNEDESAAVVYYVGRDELAGQVRGVLLWNTWDSVPPATELIRATAADPVANIEDLRGRIPVG